MLEIHSRAARVPNEPTESWLHFVVSSFTGPLTRRGPLLTLEVQGAQARSGIELELRGLLQYGNAADLPVVYEFSAFVNIQTREITITSDYDEFGGSYSENGRVLTLILHSEARRYDNPIHLVHRATWRHLS